MGQIKDSKHLYRALEAHTVLYLSLYKIYIETLIDNNILVEKDIREGVIDAINELDPKLTKDEVVANHEKVKNLLEKINYNTLKSDFDATFHNQPKFYKNYMEMFELLLTFIKVSRQQCWRLHLESLHCMIPYFFAFDMTNYARLTPIYISQMMELQHNDIQTWTLLEEGNFSVNKLANVAFTAIGADHGIEQENKTMKILGGIKGITNNERALEEHFLTAAQISSIIEDFTNAFHLKGNTGNKQDEHYQLRGTKNSRIYANIKKLTSVFENFNIGFETTETLANVITNKVMPVELAQKFLQAKERGYERYLKFVSEQLNGEKSIWETIKKEKLPTFDSLNKKVTLQLNKKIVRIKEERKLMSRFIIAARTRQDIDLAHYLGEYEFSVVPQSLFSSDGSLHQTADKSTVARELHKAITCDNVVNAPSEDGEHKVIIFDGMAVVNRIDIKKSRIKTCKEFATTFCNIIFAESEGFDEVRIIFDRYDKKSLKNQTRSKRTHGNAVQYHIQDEAIIGHLTTKQFLSSIETKNELTAFLSHKVADAMISKEVEYVVVYGRTCDTNIIDLDPELMTYNQEEADTGIMT